MLQQKFPATAKSFFATHNFTKNLKQDFILSSSNEEEALQLYKQALFFFLMKIFITFQAMILSLTTIRHQMQISYLDVQKH